MGDILKCIDLSVADAGFPKGRAPTPGGGGGYLLFGLIFEENCMKWKNVGAPLDPPMHIHAKIYVTSHQ